MRLNCTRFTAFRCLILARIYRTSRVHLTLDVFVTIHYTTFGDIARYLDKESFGKVMKRSMGFLLGMSDFYISGAPYFSEDDHRVTFPVGGSFIDVDIDPSFIAKRLTGSLWDLGFYIRALCLSVTFSHANRGANYVWTWCVSSKVKTVRSLHSVQPLSLARQRVPRCEGSPLPLLVSHVC